MKRTSVTVLIGVLSLLIAMEIFLIYIVCTTLAHEAVKFKYRDTNCTEGNEINDTTISRDTTDLTTTTTTLSSTVMSSEQFSTSTTVAANATACTTTASEISNTISTISSHITTVTPEVTSTIIMETDMTTNTTTIIMDTMATTDAVTNMTAASEINVTKKSSIIFSTTTMPPPSVAESTTVTLETSTDAPTNCNISCIVETTNVNTTTTEVTAFTKADTTTYCTKAIVPEFKYVVRDFVNGVACILANMTIQINLQYEMKDSQIGKATLMVPANAKTTGVCDKKVTEMALFWEEPVEDQIDGDDKRNRIIFLYAHDDIRFFLVSIFIDVHLDGNNFPCAQQKRMSGDTANRRQQLFSASVKDGIFTCKVGNTINIGNQIDVVISDIRLIAFNECIKNCSRTEDNCVVITDTSVNIGAFVGATIIGTVLILNLIFSISYLIWRVKRKYFATS